MLTAKDYEVMDQLKKLPQYEELKAVEDEDITYFVEKHNALRAAAMNYICGNYPKMKLSKMEEITRELLSGMKKRFYSLQLGNLEKEEDKRMKFYTVVETAELLKITKQTIYKYIKDGKLEAIKLGKNLIISEEAIQQFIENQKLK